MAPRRMSESSKSSKTVFARSAKMRLSHVRTRKQILRIQAENADQIATGKPLHAVRTSRR